MMNFKEILLVHQMTTGNKKFFSILCLSLLVTFLFAENGDTSMIKPEYGQKLFKKKLRRLCRRTAPNFAQMHTVAEWKSLKKSNTFRTEIYKICPKAIHHLKQEWVEPLYLFAVTYAKDSKKYAE